MPEVASLPEVDVRTTEVAAHADATWTALVEVIAAMASPAATAYARVVGAVPAEASGPGPLAEGSTVPGFVVAGIDPGRELVLEGRHRFSRYRLTFRLDERGLQRTQVAAESQAAFPGVHGRVYRLLVIGSGGHALAVGRMLGSIRRRAEHADDRWGPG